MFGHHVAGILASAVAERGHPSYPLDPWFFFPNARWSIR